MPMPWRIWYVMEYMSFSSFITSTSYIKSHAPFSVHQILRFHFIQRENCFISVVEHLRIDKMHGKRKIFTKLSLENEKGSHLQTLF